MDSKPFVREEIAQRLREDPLLADFLKPFPNLLGRSKRNVRVSFGRMAKRLTTTVRSGVVQFTLSRGKTTRSWCLALTPNSCEMLESKTENPNLEILAQEEVWVQIASGQLSVLEAFGQGKIRVRGDLTLARSIVRRLQRT